MFQIEPFEHSNIQSLVKFVSAIQEHERIRVPELKTGDEIGTEYALWLLKEVSTHDGVILFAWQIPCQLDLSVVGKT